MNRRERKEYVDDNIYSLLHNKYEPAEGLTNEQLTKRIWRGWKQFNAMEFRRESKYIERRLGALRHEAYHFIYEQMKDNPGVKRRKNPKFLPFALPVKEYYWTYFNAVKKPWLSRVVKSLFSKSEGLKWAGNLLDEQFDLRVKRSRGNKK